MFFLWPLKLAMRIVSLVVFAAIVYLVVSGVQVVDASKLPTSTSALSGANTIVVPDAATLPTGAPTTDFGDRLEEALGCYQARLAPQVLLTALSSTSTSNSAAAEGRTWLEQRGVPDSAIQISTSKTPAGELADAASYAGAGRTVIVVTDALDAMWVRSVLDHDGVTTEVAPAQGSERPVYDEIGQLFNGASSVAAGRMIGPQRVGWADA